MFLHRLCKTRGTRFLLKNPSVLFALLIMFLMWTLHVYGRPTGSKGFEKQVKTSKNVKDFKIYDKDFKISNKDFKNSNKGFKS